MNRQTSILLILSAVFFPLPLYIYMKKIRVGLLITLASFALMVLPAIVTRVLLFPVDIIIITTVIGLALGIGLSFYYPFRLLIQRWNEETK